MPSSYEEAGLMSSEESVGSTAKEPGSPSTGGRLVKVAMVLATTLVLLAVAAVAGAFTNKPAAAPPTAAQASLVGASVQRQGFLEALSEKADADATIVTDAGLDCNVGYSNWQAGWSKKKKEYCCNIAQKGCESIGLVTPAVMGLLVGALTAVFLAILVWAIWRKPFDKKGMMKWTGRQDSSGGYCCTQRCCGASG